MGKSPSTTFQTESGTRRGRRTERGKNSDLHGEEANVALQLHLSGMAAAPRGRHRPCPLPRSHPGAALRPSPALWPSFNHILWSTPFTWLTLFLKHLHSTHYRPGTTKVMLFILRATLQGRSPCPPFTEKETEEEVRQSQNSNPGGQLLPTRLYRPPLKRVLLEHLFFKAAPAPPPPESLPSFLLSPLALPLSPTPG